MIGNDKVNQSKDMKKLKSCDFVEKKDLEGMLYTGLHLMESLHIISLKNSDEGF